LIEILEGIQLKAVLWIILFISIDGADFFMISLNFSYSFILFLFSGFDQSFSVNMIDDIANWYVIGQQKLSNDPNIF
jgi:hypothetical protein